MKPINDNPIIDTGLEMTVSYSVPSDAIVGILFNSLRQKDEHVGLQKLPVANIPDDIRRMDPNLKDKPTHQISCQDGFVQIGENVLCIGGVMPYVSWNIFYGFVADIVGFLSEHSLISIVGPIKLRYLNFYTENIFKTINLNISMNGVEGLCNGSTVFRTEIPCEGKVTGILQITNGVHVRNESLNLDDDGSLIDIQAVMNQSSVENLSVALDNLHEHIKSLFEKLTRKD